jgi:hypothetical protein
MTQTFVLRSTLIRSNAIAAVSNAPADWIVDISEPKRSMPQNRLFHSLCGDLAKSGMKWAGKVRNAGEWKALVVSAHSVATSNGGEVIPGLEGEFVSIRESTSRMNKSRATSLIEYTIAFCVANGVELRETEAAGFGEFLERMK